MDGSFSSCLRAIVVLVTKLIIIQATFAVKTL